MTSQDQGNNLRDLLRWEQDEAGRLSREVVTVEEGQDLDLGAVFGKRTKDIPTTGTADDGNTGTGTVTSVTGGAKTKIGTYIIECVSVSPVVCTVMDPDGNSLPDAVAGAYTNPQINFTLTDSASPAITSGDQWTVEVEAGTGEVVEIDFDAVDGSQDAYGFLTAAADATDAAIDAVAIVRDAVIVPDYLAWPSASPAPTADQKAAALAQLADKGIVARTEA